MPKILKRVGIIFKKNTMATYKVTTKKTSSQPAGLTKTFVQNSTPNLTQLKEWLKQEYGINSGAGTSDFVIERL